MARAVLRGWEWQAGAQQQVAQQAAQQVVQPQVAQQMEARSRECRAEMECLMAEMFPAENRRYILSMAVLMSKCLRGVVVCP